MMVRGKDRSGEKGNLNCRIFKNIRDIGSIMLEKIKLKEYKDVSYPDQKGNTIRYTLGIIEESDFEDKKEMNEIFEHVIKVEMTNTDQVKCGLYGKKEDLERVLFNYAIYEIGESIAQNIDLQEEVSLTASEFQIRFPSGIENLHRLERFM